MLHQAIFKSDDYDMKIFLHLRNFNLILLLSRLKKRIPTYNSTNAGLYMQAAIKSTTESRLVNLKARIFGVRPFGIILLSACVHPTSVFFPSALYYRQWILNLIKA